MKLPQIVINTIKAQTHKNRVFLKILITTSFCIVSVVILMALSMYFSFNKMSVERSDWESIASFRQIEQITARMTETARAMALNVLMDYDCSAMLTATSPRQLDYFSENRIVNRIKYYRDINSYIHSIYLYNRPLNVIYSSENNRKVDVDGNFFDNEIIEIINDFDKYEFLHPIRRTVPSEDGTQDKMVMTYILSETGKQNNLDNAVIINISQDWLYSLVDNMSGMEESSILVLSQDGNVLADYKKDSSFNWDEASAVSLLQQADSDNSFSGELIQGNIKYYATCFHSQSTGWLYVKVAKWDNVFKALSQIRNTTVLILIIVLLVTLCISIIITGNFYKIYAVIEKSYYRLINSHRGDSAVLKASFISDILNGTKQIGGSELYSKLEKYEIEFSPLEDIAIIVMKIERYDEFENQVGKDYTYDMKYGIKNIFEEIAEPYFKCTGVIDANDTITFLAVIKETSAPTLKNIMQLLFEEYSVAILKFIDWKFILLYWEQTAPLNELKWLYHEYKKHIKNTFFYDSNICLDIARIEKEHAEPLEYPTMLEQRIVKAVRAGDTQSAQNLYLSFVEKIFSCQYDNFITGVTLLCFAVTRLFEEYDDDDDFERYESYIGLLDMIYHTHNMEELKTIFYDMFDALQIIKERVNHRKSAVEFLDEVRCYIRENYQNPQLSLETLAEHFSLSASYMGKTFRKSYGISVMEFINETRVSKIAQLLVTTDIPAKSIAEECGFLNVNYFYTYFKKSLGLTPQAYRNKHKN